MKVNRFFFSALNVRPALFCAAGIAALALIGQGSVASLALGQNPGGLPPPPPPPPPPMPVGNVDNPDEMPPPDAPPPPGEEGGSDMGSGAPSMPPPGRVGAAPRPMTPKDTPSTTNPGKRVPAGKELVSIDFPEPTELKDIIKAVGQWTGKNFILSKTISAKVAIISPQLVTKEEAYQAFLSALNVAGFTTVETGKFVKIVPVNVAPGANIKTFYGASWAPPTDETITQIIPLTYIQAGEVTNNIKNTLRLSTNVSAFPATNSLIVTDTGHKVRRLLEVIRILDIKGNQPQLAMEPCRNTDANDIAKKIQELFNSRGGSSPYLQKVIVDTRTNSLLLVGPPKGLDDVVRVIRRLDKPADDQGSQAQIHIRPLDYADAEKLATTLQSLATGARPGNRSTSRSPSLNPMPTMPGVQQPGTANVVADLGDVKITADKSTNALIIQGSKAAYTELDTIIQALDKRRDQVYIEVDILDVNVGNDLKVDMSFLAGAGTQNTKVSAPFGWKVGSVAPFAVSLGNNPSASDQLDRMKAIPSNAILGVLGNKPIKVGGLEISPGAFIFALKTDSNSNVLQTPNLLVADNEEATFSAVEKDYYQNTTEDAATKLRTTKWESSDANLELNIKPQVSKSDFINLDLKVTTERFDQKKSETAPPNRNSRKTNTKITVQNQQTIVISGLQRDVETETKDKVPLLGDIPILGWLFRNTGHVKSKSNLMIFITPYVVRDSNDLGKIYDKKTRERDEFLKAFYGDGAMKKSAVFSRMPSLERGKVPEPRVIPVPAKPVSSNTSPGGSESTSTLPSEDSNPVVVPGSAGGMSSSAPVFNSDSGGSMGMDPAMSNVPPPPPPPPPSDNP